VCVCVCVCVCVRACARARARNFGILSQWCWHDCCRMVTKSCTWSINWYHFHQWLRVLLTMSSHPIHRVKLHHRVYGHDTRGKSGPAQAVRSTGWAISVPADSASEIVKFTISIPRESCTNAKAKYSSSVVPPNPSVHFYNCRIRSPFCGYNTT